MVTEAAAKHALGGRWVDQAMVRVSEAPLREGNQLALLRDGPATYEEWLTAIGRAERWVHLENYIFRADKIGHRFAEALAERAAAGGRVLVDWFGYLDVPRSFWRLSTESRCGDPEGQSASAQRAARGV